MSVQSKMTAIANATRALDGSTAALTLDGIASKLGVEKTNIDAALAALVEKEVDVPAGSTSAALASLIASIEAGGGDVSPFLAIETGTYTPASDVDTFEASAVPDGANNAFFVIGIGNKNGLSVGSSGVIIAVVGNLYSTIKRLMHTSSTLNNNYPNTLSVGRFSFGLYHLQAGITYWYAVGYK